MRHFQVIEISDKFFTCSQCCDHCSDDNRYRPVQNQCKPCHRFNRTLNCYANRERDLKQVKYWQKQNPEKFRQYIYTWQKKNPEKVKMYQRNYYWAKKKD